MMAALQQQLVAAVTESFLYLLFIGLNIGDVRILMPRPAEKVAELTIGYTNIRGIYIAVDLPGNFAMRYLYFAQLISHVHQIRCGSIMIQVHAFFL